MEERWKRFSYVCSTKPTNTITFSVVVSVCVSVSCEERLWCSGDLMTDMEWGLHKSLNFI